MNKNHHLHLHLHCSFLLSRLYIQVHQQHILQIHQYQIQLHLKVLQLTMMFHYHKNLQSMKQSYILLNQHML